MRDWERIGRDVERFRVSSGWLYRTRTAPFEHSGLVFVPASAIPMADHLSDAELLDAFIRERYA